MPTLQQAVEGGRGEKDHIGAFKARQMSGEGRVTTLASNLHPLYLPVRQASHSGLLQGRPASRHTRSPAFHRVTPCPTETTSPALSCPAQTSLRTTMVGPIAPCFLGGGSESATFESRGTHWRYSPKVTIGSANPRRSDVDKDFVLAWFWLGQLD